MPNGMGANAMLNVAYGYGPNAERAK